MSETENNLSFLETESGDGYFIPTGSINVLDMQKMQKYADEIGIDFDWTELGIVILGTGDASRRAVVEILELN